MALTEFWFLIISILFIGFFVLEGFDFGVGAVAKFLGKTDTERRVYINTIGPFWDANEVWLITAGGAMFAAFPHWYATLFSGFYVPLTFMLLALIVRGVAFEFRGKVENTKWKNMWDWGILLGSILPPLIWGVALANFMTGVPIDAEMEVTESFLSLLHPFGLLGGVMFVLLCIVHGLQFITLRTESDLQERARNLGNKIAPAALLVLFAFIGFGMLNTNTFTAHGNGWIILPIITWVALLAASILNKKGRDGWAFTMTSFTIIGIVASIFIGMFPNVMLSSIDAANHLTVYNAASGDYTLKLMTYFSLALLPFVLGYQIWSYYVFRKRVTAKDHLEY